MQIKNILKAAAVVGAVAIAAPAAQAAGELSTIGGASTGPIFLLHGGEIASPVARPAQRGAGGPFTNIGTNRGGPIFLLHGGDVGTPKARPAPIVTRPAYNLQGGSQGNPEVPIYYE